MQAKGKIWALTALGLAMLLASGDTGHARKLDQNIADRYAKGAFAVSDRLVKFAGAPTVSIFCIDDACGATASKLQALIGSVVEIESTDSENSDPAIEILFYQNPDARRKSKNQYTAKPGEKLATQLHENCSVVQSRRGFEVAKVIIVVTEDAGPLENLLCILTETLRGSGVTMQGRYPESIKPYASLDEAQLETALYGFYLLMAIHFSDVTKPGQDRPSVEDALLRDFTFGN